VEKYGKTVEATDDDIIWRTRFACWLPKATDAHSEHVVRIALPLQKLLHKRLSILRYTTLAVLFI